MIEAYRIKGIRGTFVAEGNRACALYSRQEWETQSPADHEFDADGMLCFQGKRIINRVRGVKVPKWALK
jgi:hypothetical protein